MANLSTTNEPQQATSLAESSQPLATLPPAESGEASTPAGSLPADQYEIEWPRHGTRLLDQNKTPASIGPGYSVDNIHHLGAILETNYSLSPKELLVFAR
ncbi:hypothetical protein ACHAPJ_010019 [Fusarium lateritium]